MWYWDPVRNVYAVMPDENPWDPETRTDEQEPEDEENPGVNHRPIWQVTVE